MMDMGVAPTGDDEFLIRLAMHSAREHEAKGKPTFIYETKVAALEHLMVKWRLDHGVSSFSFDCRKAFESSKPLPQTVRPTSAATSSPSPYRAPKREEASSESRGWLLPVAGVAAVVIVVMVLAS